MAARSLFACSLVALLAGAVLTSEDPAERQVDEAIDNLGTGDDNDDMAPMRRMVDMLVSVAVSGVASTDQIFRNASVFGDNILWKNLIVECGKTTSLSCVKKNVFNYLDRTVSTVGDVPITDNLIFEKNYHAFENKYERTVNEPQEDADNNHRSGENATEGDARSMAALTFQGVADVLMDKGERFLKSHDLRWQLPAMVLDGAVLRLSPGALVEGGGALLTVEPAEAGAEARAEDPQGRIFFKHKKVFRRKLLLSLFALLLVVKLIKVAVMFLLPVVLGVGTAKKILLKVLLFVFPALTHLFKFCSYYHGLHAGKFHHHHHQIAHHHHHVPVHVPVPVHVHHDHHDHHEHHLEDASPHIYPASAPGPTFHPGNNFGSGPQVSGAPWHDYTSRSELVAAAQHNENELAAWGIGGGPGGGPRDPFAQHLAYSAYSYLDDGRVSRSAQPVTEPTRAVAASKADATKPAAPAKASLDVKQMMHLFQPQPQPQAQHAQHAQHAQAQDKLDQVTLLRAQHAFLLKQQQQQQQLKQQQALRLQVVTPKPVPSTTIHVAYDPFFSPILQRIDNVFVGLGFNEEACRERLVCSMYKNPPKFSPHSNLVSNELSRDASELRQPAVTNSAVARFHRYVQAARDGQDQKDCLRLYPACTVNTEL